MNRRILYIQYTNPAGYPPLEHSAGILADRGWRVQFLGTSALGTSYLNFPPHQNIEVKRWGFCPPGPMQKFHYLFFNLRAIWSALFWRPKWIYASDPFACPAAITLKRFGFHVLYHEHDSPSSEARGQRSEVGDKISAFQCFILWNRAKLARKADLCVLPNTKRAEAFVAETQTRKPVITVLNCPRREEATKPNDNIRQITLYYHGNISPDLLPEEILEALEQVPQVRLLAIGYTTIGNEDYPAQFLSRAAELTVLERVEVVGARQRAELLARARECTIGWAAMPVQSRNFNLRTMAGASNKAFDYLACGLALVVSDMPDWNAMFVEPGYARACNPEDPGSIISPLRWFAEHSKETRMMGEQGRKRVLQDWNYETQFGNVCDALSRS